MDGCATYEHDCPCQFNPVKDLPGQQQIYSAGFINPPPELLDSSIQFVFKSLNFAYLCRNYNKYSCIYEIELKQGWKELKQLPKPNSHKGERKEKG